MSSNSPDIPQSPGPPPGPRRAPRTRPKVEQRYHAARAYTRTLETLAQQKYDFADDRQFGRLEKILKDTVHGARNVREGVLQFKALDLLGSGLAREQAARLRSEIEQLFRLLEYRVEAAKQIAAGDTSVKVDTFASDFYKLLGEHQAYFSSMYAQLAKAAGKDAPLQNAAGAADDDEEEPAPPTASLGPARAPRGGLRLPRIFGSRGRAPAPAPAAPPAPPAQAYDIENLNLNVPERALGSVREQIELLKSMKIRNVNLNGIPDAPAAVVTPMTADGAAVAPGAGPDPAAELAALRKTVDDLNATIDQRVADAVKAKEDEMNASLETLKNDLEAKRVEMEQALEDLKQNLATKHEDEMRAKIAEIEAAAAEREAELKRRLEDCEEARRTMGPIPPAPPTGPGTPPTGPGTPPTGPGTPPTGPGTPPTGPTQVPPAPPSATGDPNVIRTAAVNVEEKIRRAAWERASERFEEDMRNAGFFGKMWRKSARRGYIEQYFAEELDARAGVAHEEGLAIASRFEVGIGRGDREARESFLTAAEERGIVEMESDEMAQLFRDYALGRVSDADFETEARAIVHDARRADSAVHDALGDEDHRIEGTFLERAREVRAAHQAGLGAVDLANIRIAITFGRASDVHTHTNDDDRTAADRIVGAARRWFGVKLGLERSAPTAATVAAYAVTNLVQNIATNKVVRTAGGIAAATFFAPTIGILAVSAGVAAVTAGVMTGRRRAKDLRHQRAVTERRDAVGETGSGGKLEDALNDAARRKEEMRDIMHDLAGLRGSIPAWTQADGRRAAARIAAYEMRRAEDEVDLLRFESAGTMERERLSVVRVIAECKIALRDRGWEAYLDDARKNERSAIDDALNESDRRYGRIRRKEVAKSAAIGAVTSALSAVIVGSIVNYFTDDTPATSKLVKAATTKSVLVGTEQLATQETEIAKILEGQPRMRVTRDEWWDYMTPKEYKHNELRLDILPRKPDGTIVISMARMFRHASMNAGGEISGGDISEFVEGKKVQLFISPTEGEQLEPVTAVINAQGHAEIAPSNELQRLFSDDATPTFGGHTIEAAEIVAERDGKNIIRSLATIEGDHSGVKLPPPTPKYEIENVPAEYENIPGKKGPLWTTPIPFWDPRATLGERGKKSGGARTPSGPGRRASAGAGSAPGAPSGAAPSAPPPWVPSAPAHAPATVDAYRDDVVAYLLAHPDATADDIRDELGIDLDRAGQLYADVTSGEVVPANAEEAAKHPWYGPVRAALIDEYTGRLEPSETEMNRFVHGRFPAIDWLNRHYLINAVRQRGELVGIFYATGTAPDDPVLTERYGDALSLAHANPRATRDEWNAYFSDIDPVVAHDLRETIYSDETVPDEPAEAARHPWYGTVLEFLKRRFGDDVPERDEALSSITEEFPLISLHNAYRLLEGAVENGDVDAPERVEVSADAAEARNHPFYADALRAASRTNSASTLQRANGMPNPVDVSMAVSNAISKRYSRDPGRGFEAADAFRDAMYANGDLAREIARRQREEAGISEDDARRLGEYIETHPNATRRMATDVIPDATFEQQDVLFRWAAPLVSDDPLEARKHPYYERAQAIAATVPERDEAALRRALLDELPIGQEAAYRLSVLLSRDADVFRESARLETDEVSADPEEAREHPWYASALSVAARHFDTLPRRTPLAEAIARDLSLYDYTAMGLANAMLANGDLAAALPDDPHARTTQPGTTPTPRPETASGITPEPRGDASADRDDARYWQAADIIVNAGTADDLAEKLGVELSYAEDLIASLDRNGDLALALAGEERQLQQNEALAVAAAALAPDNFAPAPGTAISIIDAIREGRPVEGEYRRVLERFREAFGNVPANAVRQLATPDAAGIDRALKEIDRAARERRTDIARHTASLRETSQSLEKMFRKIIIPGPHEGPYALLVPNLQEATDTVLEDPTDPERLARFREALRRFSANALKLAEGNAKTKAKKRSADLLETHDASVETLVHADTSRMEALRASVERADPHVAAAFLEIIPRLRIAEAEVDRLDDAVGGMDPDLLEQRKTDYAETLFARWKDPQEDGYTIDDRYVVFNTPRTLLRPIPEEADHEVAITALPDRDPAAVLRAWIKALDDVGLAKNLPFKLAVTQHLGRTPTILFYPTKEIQAERVAELLDLFRMNLAPDLLRADGVGSEISPGVVLRPSLDRMYDVLALMGHGEDARELTYERALAALYRAADDLATDGDPATADERRETHLKELLGLAGLDPERLWPVGVAYPEWVERMANPRKA